MVYEMGEANRKWAKLPPPPRLAPLRFRWQWLVHRSWGGMLVGSIIFSIGCLISLGFALSTDAVGTWRLAWSRREAPGRLEGIKNLGRAASDTNSPPLWRFRYRYSFHPPGGTPMQGTSYGEATSERRSKDVTVEYDPRDPLYNRIRGTRTRLCPMEDAFLSFGLAPFVGLAVTAGAIWYGLRPIRVLKRGESAVATIVTYTLVLGTDGDAALRVAARGLPPGPADASCHQDADGDFVGSRGRRDGARSPWCDRVRVRVSHPRRRRRPDNWVGRPWRLPRGLIGADGALRPRPAAPRPSAGGAARVGAGQTRRRLGGRGRS